MIKPLSLPLLPQGQDLLAIAYRRFDHWSKHEHLCEHDSILDCIRMYARVNGTLPLDTSSPRA